MKKCFLSVVTLGSVLAMATPAMATAVGGFTGIFAVTPDAGPATASRSVGNWTATITGTGSIEPLGTDSVDIRALPPILQVLGQASFVPPPDFFTSTATLAMNAPFSGQYSFDYNADGFGLTFFSTLGGSVPLLNTGTLIRNLTAGEHFGFRAIAESDTQALMGTGRAGGSLAAVGSQFLNISNPQFNVPEASSLGGLAVVGLMAWGVSLKRRQA